MELNIKFDEKMIIETANRVLDESMYKGKTIREWADLIANPKTNADRIRSMSDEELAKFLTKKMYARIAGDWKKWLDWLRQEAEGGE